MNKFVILATRRSGSTLLQQVLFQYLHKYYNCQANIKEYFNVKMSSRHLEDIYENGIFITRKWGANKNSKKSFQLLIKDTGSNLEYYKNYNSKIFFDTAEEENAEMRKRLMLLQKYDKIYYLNKLFSNHLLPEILNFYNDKEYTFICISRKNIFDQILSYGILDYFKSGVVKNGYLPIFKNNEITMKKSSFCLIERCIVQYNQLLPKINKKIFITYENLFELHDKKEIFNLLDIKIPNDFKLNESILCTKMSPDNKANLFKNINKIQEWYLNSSLSTLS